MADLIKYFDIFVAGPMGDPSDDGAGVAVRDHIGNIRAALAPIKAKIEADDPSVRVRIKHPEQVLAGTITDQVFEDILSSEIGILDLSARSPAVMYELALFNALNIPAVMLTFAHAVDQIPFYQRDQFFQTVGTYDVPELSETLMGVFGSLLRNDPEDDREPFDTAVLAQKVSPNPITRFFKIALVDASATTGLATGYYYNMMQYIADARDRHLERAGFTRPMSIIEPDDLEDVERIRPALDAAANRLDLPIRPVELVVPVHPRGQLRVYEIGGFPFDIPTPLSAQQSSPMHLLLARRFLAQGIGAGRQRAQAISRSRQRSMIEKFFFVLEFLADENIGKSNALFRRITLTDFLQEVAAANGRTL